MKDLVFELTDVRFSYLGRFPALCGISMSIHQGEKISIIGANGTGKSTLLTMLDGLIFPCQGAIKAFGRELNEDLLDDDEFSRFFRMKVGFVFQNPDVQLFCPSVKEDIVFGPLQMGVPKEEIKRRLENVITTLAISDLLERAPHQLSIGEKRKVAIASVLVIEPRVIILDEPTAGLDPLTSRQIIEIILKLNLSGCTIVTATHDLHAIPEISDLTYVFNKDKRIVRCDTPYEILSDKEFLEANNLIHIHSHLHNHKIHTHEHLYSSHHPEF